MLVLAGWLLSAGAATAPAQTAKPAVPAGLEKSRATFRTQADGIQKDFQAATSKLNEEYRKRLTDLESAFQSKGELEALLLVRQERTRFEQQQTLNINDVMAGSDAIASEQNRYLTTLRALRDDTDVKLLRLTKAYLEYLDKLKRSLTRQDDITGALAVQKEIDSLPKLDDITLPEDAPTASKEGGTAPKHAPPAGDASAVVRAPQGQIWVLIFQDQVPARKIPVYFIESNTGRMFDVETDTLGRARFQVQGGGEYRVIVYSEGFAKEEIADALSGRTYRLSLKPSDRAMGFVEIREKKFTIPGLGRFELPYSMGNEGMTVRAADSAVRFEEWGSRRGEIWMHPGQDYTLTRGEKDRYQLELVRLGNSGRLFVEWQKLP